MANLWVGRRAFAVGLLALMIGLVGSFGARAEDSGTLDEAQALLQKAVAEIKAVGKEAAFAKFNSHEGGFIEKDLYVFVFGLDGMTLAHGGNPSMVGRNLAGLKDVDGKPFMQDMMDLAKNAGGGITNYKWLDPKTKKIEAKRSYIVRIDDYFVGVGAYVR